MTYETPTDLPELEPLNVALADFSVCALCPFVLDCADPELPEEQHYD